jgi:hypothetical protein
MTTPQSQFPLAVSANILVQETGDEALVYKLDTHQYFHLNRISNLVWQSCDGTKEVDRIAGEIGRKLKQNIPVETVWLSVDTLQRTGLVTAPNLQPPASLRGLNRRQMVKRISLAAGAVSLPLIVSMVAPRALNAQSMSGVPGNVDLCSGQEGGVGNDQKKTPNGGLCNGHGNCCSNNCCPLGNGQGVCLPAGQSC